MKLKYLLPFIGFGLLSNQLQAQTSKEDTAKAEINLTPELLKRFKDEPLRKDSLENSRKNIKKQKTRLLPIIPYGEVKPHNLSAWLSSNELSGIPEIYGEAGFYLKGIVDEKDSIGAIIRQAPLDKALENYFLNDSYISFLKKKFGQSQRIEDFCKINAITPKRRILED